MGGMMRCFSHSSGQHAAAALAVMWSQQQRRPWQALLPSVASCLHNHLEKSKLNQVISP